MWITGRRLFQAEKKPSAKALRWKVFREQAGSHCGWSGMSKGEIRSEVRGGQSVCRPWSP